MVQTTGFQEALRKLAALIETIINPPAGDNVLPFPEAVPS